MVVVSICQMMVSVSHTVVFRQLIVATAVAVMVTCSVTVIQLSSHMVSICQMMSVK